jgi:heme-degrading monooxygenase HmoA
MTRSLSRAIIGGPVRNAFVYVWEYRVRAEAAAAFEAAYCATGDWARLFRAHEGYERTELLRSDVDPQRYLTIDHWRSREDYERFRASAASAFEALDAACGELTESESHRGDFTPVGC